MGYVRMCLYCHMYNIHIVSLYIIIDYNIILMAYWTTLHVGHIPYMFCVCHTIPIHMHVARYECKK